MLKKALAFVAAGAICISVTGCNGSKTKNVSNGFNVKPAEVMVFTPDSVNIDSSLLKEDKVSQVKLPADYYKDMDKTIKEIENATGSNTVKAVVISSDKPDLYKAFDKIKENKPGIVTVASDLYEFDTKNGSNILGMDTNIDLGFKSLKSKDGDAIAQTAKNMGASTLFVYVRPSDIKDAGTGYQLEQIKNFCANNNLNMMAVSVPDDKKNAGEIQSFLAQDINNKIQKFGNNIAVTGMNKDINEMILKRAKDAKFMVPGMIFKDNIEEKKSYNSVFNLKMNDKDLMDGNMFRKKMTSEMKKLGLEKKIAAFSRSDMQSAVELGVLCAESITSTKRAIYKGYNEVFDETVSDDKLYDLINENLDTYFKFDRMDNSSTYFKSLEQYPDVY